MKLILVALKTSFTKEHLYKRYVYLLGGVQAAGTGSLQAEQSGPAVHQRARDPSTPGGALLPYPAPVQGARPTGSYNHNKFKNNII